MPQSLRQIKRRIKSVENTKKITKAMEMVAASKLRKYQDLLGQTRAYAHELDRMLRRITSTATSYTHPFFEKREEGNALIFLISSDSGLCGSYNFNLFQTVERFLAERISPNSFFTIGRQGFNYLKRKKQTVVGEIGIPRPQEISGALKNIMETAKNYFLEKKVGLVYFIYTDFISMANYRPKVEQLLPLEGIEAEDEQPNVSTVEYILEPSPEKILEDMIPHYLELKIEQALKGALVSEQVSRMMAMRQATDNATEMIDSLTLQRNKARQASITKELIEIVSGFKAQQAK